MKRLVLDGSPCRRSHSRVVFILVLLVFLPCFSLNWLTLPACKADDQASKAIRRSSSESGLSIKDQKRVALVIGNNAYKEVPLRNPANDAEDIAGVLRTLGFTVQTKINANQREIEDAVKEFAREIQDGDVGLFYFSGHGVQVGGDNYLIPVAGSIETEADCRYKAVSAGFILGKMEESRNRTNIFILDACRNNPFKGFRSMSRGLTMMDAPVGTFIAYATAPGSVAADGTGRNSPYAKHLLGAIKKKDLGIEYVFKEVLREVRKETEGKQVPWIASSLQYDFYFNQSTLTSSPMKPSEGGRTESEQEVAKLREAQRLAALEKERLEKENQELLARISPTRPGLQSQGISHHLKTLFLLAESGDALSQCSLGTSYYHGFEVAKDYQEAAKWYRKAAEQGHMIAQFDLGEMYREGKGVSKDPKEAIQWYRKAADQGSSQAYHALRRLGEAVK